MSSRPDFLFFESAEHSRHTSRAPSEAVSIGPHHVQSHDPHHPTGRVVGSRVWQQPRPLKALPVKRSRTSAAAQLDEDVVQRVANLHLMAHRRNQAASSGHHCVQNPIDSGQLPSYDPSREHKSSPAPSAAASLSHSLARPIPISCPDRWNQSRYLPASSSSKVKPGLQALRHRLEQTGRKKPRRRSYKSFNHQTQPDYDDGETDAAKILAALSRTSSMPPVSCSVSEPPTSPVALDGEASDVESDYDEGEQEWDCSNSLKRKSMDESPSPPTGRERKSKRRATVSDINYKGMA